MTKERRKKWENRSEKQKQKTEWNIFKVKGDRQLRKEARKERRRNGTEQVKK